MVAHKIRALKSETSKLKLITKFTVKLAKIPTSPILKTVTNFNP